MSLCWSMIRWWGSGRLLLWNDNLETILLVMLKFFKLKTVNGDWTLGTALVIVVITLVVHNDVPPEAYEMNRILKWLPCCSVLKVGKSLILADDFIDFGENHGSSKVNWVSWSLVVTAGILDAWKLPVQILLLLDIAYSQYDAHCIVHGNEIVSVLFSSSQFSQCSLRTSRKLSEHSLLLAKVWALSLPLPSLYHTNVAISRLFQVALWKDSSSSDSHLWRISCQTQVVQLPDCHYW